ncbi:hypothetical protein EVAR_87686_1 [Eumeta japonica]|uniref:Uncharacterized protein n=1 Tax=Eumeta variegata TaxID=151549 RepID=A0A4C1XND0_EUMVA|nr:hypothetical protein EVAR_87686_1 [Eumeta japonica]
MLFINQFVVPSDFYVWGRAKELVYATEVQNVEDLREWIEAAFQKNQQEMLLSTTTVEIRRRCRACIANGDPFETPILERNSWRNGNAKSRGSESKAGPQDWKLKGSGKVNYHRAYDSQRRNSLSANVRKAAGQS